MPQHPTHSHRSPARPYPEVIAPLIGLQFIALAWVVLNQFRNHLGLHAGDRSGLVFKGYLGAELFFVITGFVTAHLYVEARRTGAFRYLNFLWERLARVYPLHLVTIGVLAALMAAAGAAGVAYQSGVGGLHSLTSNLLLIQAWGVEPTVSWNFPSWLISAEWFAYIIFPVTAWIAFKLWRGPTMAILAPVVLFTLAFLVCARKGFLFSDMTAQIGALQTIPAFLLGAGLCRLGRAWDLPRRWAGGLAAAAGVWIIVAALLRLSDIVLFPAFGLLVFALAETAKGDRPLLGGPVMVYLGRISRAMFLVYLLADMFYFHAMAKLVPHPHGAIAWLVWSGVYPFIIVAASLAYHLVQRPAERWLQGLNHPVPGASTIAATA